MSGETRRFWDRFLATSSETGPSSSGDGARSRLGRKTRSLWGEQFNLVDSGLDEVQVVRFVNDLLERYNRLKEASERQGTSAQVSSYLQRVMGEIQQVESTITAQIRRDSESEGARFLEEARNQAQEIVGQARAEAAQIAGQEAEAILGASRKKAEIAEGQVRLQAQLMLEKARSQLQSHIRHEGGEAYRRLLNALKNLGTEAQQLEDEWQRRPARLWEEEDFKIILDADDLDSQTGTGRFGAL
jgi:cell division septum initiation protein DivIVA